MAASYKTLDEVIRVIREHVSEETFKAIVSDLRTVKGNSSFEESIKRLHSKVMEDLK